MNNLFAESITGKFSLFSFLNYEPIIPILFNFGRFQSLIIIRNEFKHLFYYLRNEKRENFHVIDSVKR
jgi:hypothetical protein